MSVYNDALNLKKDIIDNVDELYTYIILYKKRVAELEQVVNTLYNEDYGTDGAAVKKGKMEKVFEKLDSYNFSNAGDLKSINISITTEVIETKEGK